MTKDSYIQRVLQILNEADVNTEELIGADMTTITLFIEKHYPASWRRALKAMRRTWFEPQSFVTGAKVANGPEGTGYVIVPDDYLELYSFRMTGWKTDCIEAPEETALINRKQANEFTRGTAQRPVCVIRTTMYNGTVKRALHYYSLPSTADGSNQTIEKALYIPNVTTLGNTINVTEQGAEPLCWISAATILTTLEKEQTAKIIESKITEII